ncbi:hypothetical protein ACB092_06G112300 [Castanea dentata]
MAKWRFWFWLVLVLAYAFLCCTSQARSPDPFSKSNANESLVLKSAREVLKESIRRQEIIGKLDIPTRVSPGGPDPHHH